MDPYVQLHLADAANDLDLIVAYLRLTPLELSTKTPIRFEMSADDLDYKEAALIQTASGRQVGLFRYPRAPKSDYTAIAVSRNTEDIVTVLNEIMETLNISSSEVLSYHPQFRFEPHSLWRQDDFGNKVKVQEFPCRADATKKLRELISASHKQLYWIEADPREGR